MPLFELSRSWLLGHLHQAYRSCQDLKVTSPPPLKAYLPILVTVYYHGFCSLPSVNCTCLPGETSSQADRLLHCMFVYVCSRFVKPRCQAALVGFIDILVRSFACRRTATERGNMWNVRKLGLRRLLDVISSSFFNRNRVQRDSGSTPLNDVQQWARFLSLADANS